MSLERLCNRPAGFGVEPDASAAESNEPAVDRTLQGEPNTK
jgi:hypothetical protein